MVEKFRIFVAFLSFLIEIRVLEVMDYPFCFLFCDMQRYIIFLSTQKNDDIFTCEYDYSCSGFSASNGLKNTESTTL